MESVQPRGDRTQDWHPGGSFTKRQCPAEGPLPVLADVARDGPAAAGLGWSVAKPCVRWLAFDFLVTRAQTDFPFRREHRIRIDPITRCRDASDGWTLQPQPAASPFQLKNEDLVAGDRLPAAFAAPLVFECKPEMEFIQVLENVEFVFRREPQRGGGVHAAHDRSGLLV